MSDFREIVTNRIISAITVGETPWQHPLRLGYETPDGNPYNPITQRNYRGANLIWLQMASRDKTTFHDPRWMTARQARGFDGRIRDGEEGTKIEYWSWNADMPLLDHDGNAKKDKDGRVITETVRQNQPRVFYATVFNAEQIDGIEERGRRPFEIDTFEKVQSALEGSGILLVHDMKDSAYYDPAENKIHLPPNEVFMDRDTAMDYSALAIHHVAHAALHKLNVFDSHGLRGEMASVILAGELGLGMPTQFHQRDDNAILAALKDDHNEFFRAGRDADMAAVWILHPEKRQEIEQRAHAKIEASQQKAVDMKLDQRHYINVPFEEKDEAKAQGARWDRNAKAWFVGKDSDLSKIAKWDIPPPTAEGQVTPVEEFAAFCKKQGLVIDGEPIMDGAWHRVPLEGEESSPKKGGSYKGYLDGKPNGLVQNFRDGDEGKPAKWVSTGVSINANERAKYEEQWANRKEERSAELVAQREEAARTAFGLMSNNAWADPAHCPYLKKKGVGSYGVKQFSDGTVLIPARDIDGKLRSVQFVTDESKTFLKGSQKSGNFHTLDSGKTMGKGPIIVAEGYATAASIHEATGRPVIMAFDSNNLEPVAAALRGRYPKAEIVIAADDDHKLVAEGKSNAGIVKATKAAEMVAGTVIAVKLTDELKARGASDFDDLRQESGMPAVKAQIEEGLKAARAKGKAAGQGVAAE